MRAGSSRSASSRGTRLSGGHTFDTTVAAAGVPVRTIQEWMGHDDIKTTRVYTHYQPSEGEVDAIDRASA